MHHKQRQHTNGTRILEMQRYLIIYGFNIHSRLSLLSYFPRGIGFLKLVGAS